MSIRSKLIACGAFCAVVITGGLQTAQADVIQCTGSQTITNATSVTYDPSSNTCTITDTSSPPAGVGFISFVYQFGGPPQVFVQARADDNLDGTVSDSDHQGITGFPDNNVSTTRTVPAGRSHSASNVRSQSSTTVITAQTSAGNTSTMTIDFTVVTDTSLNITSASVNDPSFTAPSSGAQAPPRALQAGVARSQSQVVSTNIGTRISSIGGGPSGGGASAGPGTPAGTGGNTGGQSVPGTGTGSDSGDDDGQSNFAGFQRTVGGSTWRDFAMLASFDTSALFGVTATDGASSPTTPVDRAAFAPSRNLTFWGHGSFTNVENSRNDGDTDSRYTGDVWGYNLGLDYRFASGFVAGLSVGYSETALDTTFNTGDYTEENITLTPYAVYPLNDNLSLSFFGGASVGDVEQTRDSGTVRGTTDSLMLMAAFGASYSLTPDDNIPLDLTAKFDLNVSHKTIDAYTESDGSVVEEQTSNTRQVSPGLEAAYRFDVGNGNTLAPFGSAAMVYDFLDPINGDDVAYELGGGLRVTSDSTGWSGSIEADTQLDRRDYQQYSVKGTIAYGMTVDLFGEAASDETVSFTVAPQFVSETPSLTSSMRYTHAESGLSFDLDVTHVLPQLAGGASNTRGDVKLTLPF